MGAPSNGSKTAHSKVANGSNAGTSGNTTAASGNTATSSKRSSSSADGDYQLVQHEVLYSQSSQYEVSFFSRRIDNLLCQKCVRTVLFSELCVSLLFQERKSLKLIAESAIEGLHQLSKSDLSLHQSHFELNSIVFVFIRWRSFTNIECEK